MALFVGVVKVEVIAKNLEEAHDELAKVVKAAQEIGIVTQMETEKIR